MQNSFNAGEISPRLTGRTDIEKYGSGALLIQNLVVQVQGGLKHRSGTRFVSEVNNSANKTRLVSFVVSTTKAYVLEFSNNLIRFYTDEGIIESGGSPVELVTAYTTAEIPDLKFSQTVDSLYICYPSRPTAKITRTSDVVWTLADVDFQDGPYLAENTTATTLDPAATSGNGVTVTASAVTGINGGVGFKSTDVGRLMRITKQGGGDGSVGWAEIVEFTDTTHVKVDIKSNFAEAATTTEWRLGAFGSAFNLGYPSVLAFHEQRLWVGANLGAAQTVYASVISLFETFSPTDLDDAVQDDSGLVYTIASDQANAIRWIDATRTLILGTSGGIWPVQATTRLEPITPTNVQIKRSTVGGVSSVYPVHVDDISIYVSITKRQVLAVGYEGERDTYIADDRTLLADHITLSGIDEIAYAKEPNSVVWGVRNDGILVGLTDSAAQRVFGWHRHILGGSFGDGDAVVESVTVIPSPSGDPNSTGRVNIPHDQVWLVVKRTIDGATVRYVEFIEDDFADSDVQEDAFFVDSGLTYNGVAKSTITGLDHLEGETVQIVAGGGAHPDCTVVDGSITLNRTHTKVHIGLYPMAEVDTLNIEPVSRRGSSQGRKKRIPSVTLRFDRTLGGEVCNNPDLDKFDPIFFRSAGDPMDEPPPLFTGDKIMALECGWSREARMKVRQPQPLPFNLVALIPNVELSGR
jgi:hypothetical protein